MRHPLLHGIDLGSPLRAGRTTRTAAGLDLEAGGTDIWGTSDEGHFAFTPVDGNFEASVRVRALSMADVYTKAGLMLRASLAAGSAHVMLLAFGDNQPRNNNNGGLEFQSRVASDGPCTGIYPPQPLPPQPDFPVNFPDVWLKLLRKGATFTAQTGTDGRTWRTFCVHRQELPTQAYLGLAVTSHHPKQTVRAAFEPLTLADQT